MAYLVQARLDDIALTTSVESAKEAYAKAIEWQLVEQYANVTISCGNNIYSIDEFALVMAEAMAKAADNSGC